MNKVAGHDRVLLGEGLFETLRFEGQKPFYVKLHWQRMRQAAKKLHIPFTLSFTDWQAAITQCISEAKFDAGGVKVILAAGPATRGLEKTASHPYFIMQAFPYSSEKKTIRLIRSAWVRDAKNPIYGLKSVNYLEAIIARRKALASRVDDVLFFNTEGYATETPVANFFIVKEDILYTPALSCGILPGITRARILNLCQKEHIVCIEKNIDYQTILNADSFFVCNALQGITMVISFEQKEFLCESTLLSKLQNLIYEDRLTYTEG